MLAGELEDKLGVALDLFRWRHGSEDRACNFAIVLLHDMTVGEMRRYRPIRAGERRAELTA